MIRIRAINTWRRVWTQQTQIQATPFVPSQYFFSLSLSLSADDAWASFQFHQKLSDWQPFLPCLPPFWQRGFALGFRVPLFASWCCILCAAAYKIDNFLLKCAENFVDVGCVYIIYTICMYCMMFFCFSHHANHLFFITNKFSAEVSVHS